MTLSLTQSINHYSLTDLVDTECDTLSSTLHATTLSVVRLSGCTSLVVRWRHGVAVERQIYDREVAGSGLGRALRHKNSGQVSHTYG